MLSPTFQHDQYDGGSLADGPSMWRIDWGDIFWWLRR
jgi:hypothetical protein